MSIPAILIELTKLGIVALTEKSVETFVETKIKPIFENWGKEDSRSIELEECLSEYLLRCYAKNNIMTTIVFRGMQKTLEDLYIPLTLEEYRNENKQWVIDESCYDILDNYSRILIIDMAGMGKSTIVKYFACQGINLDKSVPIVIELRKLGKKQSILEYIQMQINSYDKNIEISEIAVMLKKGDFVIFFDGYDEIANENKPDVLDAIQEFTNKAANTKVVITSREEDDLNSLGEYKCVNIKPLTREEAYTLIKRYDNDGEISKKLIKRLKEDSSMDILSEFLENPLLVSLLYKTFEYKEEIPYKKIGFYEQVYAALFNDHDKTKGGAYVHEKKTKLDKYQFEQVLRALGFLSLKEDKIEFSDQLIHHLLEQSIKRFSWLKIRVDDFLHDITHAVPFIQKDGNEYKWVHKSFMEYFAACFICYDNKVLEENYLKKMLSSNFNYYNVLSFCYDIDTLNFRKYLVLPYLENYISRYEQNFENGYLEKINENDLYLAKSIYAIIEKAYILNTLKNKESKERFKDVFNILHDISSVHTFHIDDLEYTFSYKIINNRIFKLMIEKNPELYEDSNISIRFPNGYQYQFQYSFDDDINNPIYEDKDVFSKIINDFYSVLYDDGYKLLKYDVCKKVIDEIKAENEFINNDIFDL